MSVSIAYICDPGSGTLANAVRLAKASASGILGFDLELCRFLQMECCAARVRLPIVFRGLEVLEAITDHGKLLTLMRPFLKSSDPQIVSKCVLVLGRRCSSVGWMHHVMSEVDDRIRANLIESLWGRDEPEVEKVLEAALKDPHHRVAANAVFGLFLLGSEAYLSGLESLVASEDPSHRRSAVWVARTAATSEAVDRIKLLYRDLDPGVRHAAFEALVVSRRQAAA